MTKSVEIIPKGSTLTIGTLMEAVSYDDMIHSSQMVNARVKCNVSSNDVEFWFFIA